MNHKWNVKKHNKEHHTITCDCCNSSINTTNSIYFCSYRIRVIGYIVFAFLLGFAISTWVDLISIASHI